MRRKTEEESGDELSDPCANENDPHFCQVLMRPDSPYQTVSKPQIEKMASRRMDRLTTPLGASIDRQAVRVCLLVKLGGFQRTRCVYSDCASGSGRGDPECLQTSTVYWEEVRRDDYHKLMGA